MSGNWAETKWHKPTGAIHIGKDTDTDIHPHIEVFWLVCCAGGCSGPAHTVAHDTITSCMGVCIYGALWFLHHWKTLSAAQRPHTLFIKAAETTVFLLPSACGGTQGCFVRQVLKQQLVSVTCVSRMTSAVTSQRSEFTCCLSGKINRTEPHMHTHQPCWGLSSNQFFCERENVSSDWFYLGFLTEKPTTVSKCSSRNWSA